MKKRIFKKCLFAAFLVILFTIVISIMLKYDVEGERELPFSISKLLIISTVDGSLNEDSENIWNIGITQVNDLYMYIDKTIEDDEQTIKEIKIENFVVNKNPSKGKLKVLRPTGEIANLYTHSHQDYLNDKIIYTGGVIDDLKSLEISNNGGILGFRVAVEELGNYISNEDEEITYDGKLLSNLGVTIPEIAFDMSFDIIIKTSKNISFKGTINLNMPIETVIEEGSSSKEITDFSNVVFKRI